MTQLITSIKDLKKIRSTIQNSVSFVPTMGALHGGHMSLLEKAIELGDTVFVSVFVNPLQFSGAEDLDNYPKTLEADMAKCQDLGIDYLFAPSEAEFYPDGKEAVSIIKANPNLVGALCDLSRPGHFDGVCTVVKLLFDLVQPKYAIFGEKDYQQLLVIKAMVEDLAMDLKVVSAETVREESGLAMSSRNQYLNDEQLEIAANIYKELLDLKTKSDNSLDARLERARAKLETCGMAVEYLELYNSRICVAAKLGSTRLIDNIVL